MPAKLHIHKGTKYFVSSPDPKLLILSGTHGDEAGVTKHITTYIDSHESVIPPYVYIPEVSPSATALGTRNNKYNHDLNRHFYDTPTDPEVISCVEILKPFSFILCLAFHEDPDRTKSFYLYDHEQMNHEQLIRYERLILSTGAQLFTGIDDEQDGHLGLHVERGYVRTPPEDMSEARGFSMRWLLAHGKAKRVLNPEVPGKAKDDLKKKLVSAIFDFSLPLIQ